MASKRREATPQNIDDIRAMRAAGINWCDIARAMHTSEPVIIRWAVEHLGHVPQPRPPRAKPEPRPVPPVTTPKLRGVAPPANVRSDGVPLRPFHPTSWNAINEPWADFHAQLGLPPLPKQVAP